MTDGRPAAEPLISIRDLVVGFGEQIVLDHLALDVRRGEILGVVGASGSGKSVLLRTVIGLVPKRQGRIVIAGSRDAERDGGPNGVANGAALGHPVPAGRAVLLPDGAAERPISVAGKSRSLRAAA